MDTKTMSIADFCNVGKHIINENFSQEEKNSLLTSTFNLIEEKSKALAVEISNPDCQVNQIIADYIV